MSSLSVSKLMRHHNVSREKRELVKLIGEYGEHLASLLIDKPMNEFCRERALAALKEATMWATSGICYDEPIAP